MVEHTIKKYGRKNVAHISTFGTMGTKGALKDVGRVLDIDFFTMNKKIGKEIPDDAEDIADAVEKNEELQHYKEKYPKLFKYAKQIEGKPRNLGTHASAIVATPEPVTHYTPLARTKDSDGNINYITQTEMHDSEELGLLKIDFLGLKTLNIIENTINAVHKRDDLEQFNYIPDLDNLWEDLPLDDEEVYKNIYQKADNNGVFQVESYLFTDILKRMQPENFENIVALVALGRPGPIDAGLVDNYINRMHGKEEIEYPHECLEGYLDDTYGLMIFQEDVMETAREIAGFSLGEADILRRAVGKKEAEVMEKVRKKFMKGAQEQGHSEEFARELFSKIEKFAGYAFNLSHAAAYGMISYLTAYLKYYFPAEFYAALLTSEAKKSSTESSLKEYVSDCYQRGIEILPPDINESGRNFTAIGGNKIRYGLKSIKHVGGRAFNNIMVNRPFDSLRDFMRKIKKRVVHKTVVEALIKAGAFDKFDDNRKKLLKKYKELKNTKLNQMSLFGNQEMTVNIETTEQNVIEMEMETLETSVTYPSDFDLASDGEVLKIEGMVQDKNEICDKNDNLMAFVDLETKTETITVVVFTDLYTKNNDLFEAGFNLEVEGKKDDDNLLLNAVKLIEGDVYNQKAV